MNKLILTLNWKLKVGFFLVPGDEGEGMSLSTTMEIPEFSDPAILAVKQSQVKFRYSKEDLLELRETSLSRKYPEFLNPAFNK